LIYDSYHIRTCDRFYSLKMNARLILYNTNVYFVYRHANAGKKNYTNHIRLFIVDWAFQNYNVPNTRNTNNDHITSLYADDTFY
jgi:hypothetical protein